MRGVADKPRVATPYCDARKSMKCRMTRGYVCATHIQCQLIYVRAAYINLIMRERKIENVVGALALALSDALHFGTQMRAPEPGPAASAIALLHHEPGLTIEQLRRALRLSHPGAVRLVDRLTKEGLVERRASVEDRRAVALHLTRQGDESCAAILMARRSSIACALQSLNPDERKLLGRLAEKLLSGLIQNEDQAYQVCRLCDRQSCNACPVEAALEAE